MKIVALTGGSGSGKSTILNGIRDHFGDDITILSLDDYYHPVTEIPVDDKGETNFDLPEAIIYDNLIRDIYALQKGETVEIDTYTFNRDMMKSECVIKTPSLWLIVEGLFALHDMRVREMIDIKVFISASVETRLKRRKYRDLTIRGYNNREVQYQWDNHVRPSDIEFIQPWKEKCDVVIDNEDNWQEGVANLIRKMDVVSEKV
ncbi:MAG: uridine kinase family protein [Flavobacteriales bacterium]|jgi:uridine kinase|tara:strand:- start:1321 stop:1932 length:612 start_codon:yes stop_codon:yes gene_type:complete